VEPEKYCLLASDPVHSGRSLLTLQRERLSQCYIMELTTLFLNEDEIIVDAG
jgi:hypothetical protein